MPDTDHGDDEPNEILAAAREAKARDERVRKGDKEKDKGNVPLTAIGIGLGIGSAALAAAVLYSNRDKRKRD